MAAHPPASVGRPTLRFALVLLLLLGRWPVRPVWAEPAPTFTAAQIASLDRLLVLIERRLELAPAVARAKWNRHLAIDDPVREAEILKAVVEGADPLPRPLVEAFFRDQMEAGKQIQRALTRCWQSQRAPPFAQVEDLGTDLRPQFDALTPQLLEALQTVLPLRREAGWGELLAQRARVQLQRQAPLVRAQALQTLYP